MNGIIEYDQKLTSLPRFLLIRQHLPKKSYWNIILIFTLIFYIAFTLQIVYLVPPKTIFRTWQCCFRMEFVLDVAVIFSSYFFLQQLEYRFQMLNDSWEYLRPGFPAVPDDLTQSITEITLDNIRLLHAELSDLLRIFSMGYGKMLLGFFVFNYINMLVGFYYNIIHPMNYITDEKFNFHNFFTNSLPYISSLQNIVFILSIIVAASRVHDKVTMI
ncbi:uncharacterized protein LOC111029308, partial [Myzus persicae]|uniref:uncharacterized protein LOC111026738 n=1 Tax=Myzus persicae TaxID=13164 RepID=UPI000B936D20